MYYSHIYICTQWLLMFMCNVCVYESVLCINGHAFDYKWTSPCVCVYVCVVMVMCVRICAWASVRCVCRMPPSLPVGRPPTHCPFTGWFCVFIVSSVAHNYHFIYKLWQTKRTECRVCALSLSSCSYSSFATTIMNIINTTTTTTITIIIIIMTMIIIMIMIMRTMAHRKTTQGGSSLPSFLPLTIPGRDCRAAWGGRDGGVSTGDR